MPGHGRTPEVDLRQVQVVGLARERDPLRGVVTTQGNRVAVVEFEPVAGRAPSALFVDEATTAAVPLVHGPADGGREWRETGFVSVCAGLLRGAFVRPKRRASSLSSFSVTASSMTAARSAPGTEERRRAWSPSSLSRSPALAVNWTR